MEKYYVRTPVIARALQTITKKMRFQVVASHIRSILYNPRFLSWTGASVRFSGFLARRDDDADCILLGGATLPESRKSVQSRP